jgi:hypothetical protein
MAFCASQPRPSNFSLLEKPASRIHPNTASQPRPRSGDHCLAQPDMQRQFQPPTKPNWTSTLSVTSVCCRAREPLPLIAGLWGPSRGVQRQHHLWRQRQLHVARPVRAFSAVTQYQRRGEPETSYIHSDSDACTRSRGGGRALFPVPIKRGWPNHARSNTVQMAHWRDNWTW